MTRWVSQHGVLYLLIRFQSNSLQTIDAIQLERLVEHHEEKVMSLMVWSSKTNNARCKCRFVVFNHTSKLDGAFITTTPSDPNYSFSSLGFRSYRLPWSIIPPLVSISFPRYIIGRHFTSTKALTPRPDDATM